MKTLAFFVIALTTASAAYAGDTAVVLSCLQQIDSTTANPNAYTACQGVKADADVTAVLKCVQQVDAAYSSPLVFAACQGVKN